MKLAIRTSSGPYGVGLFSDHGSLLASREAEPTPIRSGNVGDLLHDMLADIGCSASDLTELIVDIGPGGLSSTRAGVSFANALSFGVGAALRGVSALDVQFHDVCPAQARHILSTRPALGQRVFWAFYDQEVLVDQGCGVPEEVITKLLVTSDQLSVVGPLQRLKINFESINNVAFINVDPPRLESLFKASRVYPYAYSSASILEPITSIEGMRRE